MRLMGKTFGHDTCDNKMNKSKLCLICACVGLFFLTFHPQSHKSGCPVAGLTVNPLWPSGCSPWPPCLMSLPHQV